MRHVSFHVSSLQHTWYVSCHTQTLQHVSCHISHINPTTHVICLISRINSTTHEYTLQHNSCLMFECVAVCCSVLQCIAVCRSVLQCVAERQYNTNHVSCYVYTLQHMYTLYNTYNFSHVAQTSLQHAATRCCDTLQHTATHWETHVIAFLSRRTKKYSMNHVS